MKQMILATIVAALLAGCNEQSPPSVPLQKMTAATRELSGDPQEIWVPSTGRFQVRRADVFRDDLAYGGKRAIYILIDLKTGREYVGVSGIGLSETGVHSSGKTSTSDER